MGILHSHHGYSNHGHKRERDGEERLETEVEFMDRERQREGGREMEFRDRERHGEGGRGDGV